MRTQISTDGAKELKLMLKNTSLVDAELDIMLGFVDIMSGKASEENEASLSRLCDRQTEEIRVLKSVVESQKIDLDLGPHTEIRSGDFAFIAYTAYNPTRYFIQEGNNEDKEIPEPEINKAFRKLYFRDSKGNTCRNCGSLPEYCKGCNNYNLWRK